MAANMKDPEEQYRMEVQHRYNAAKKRAPEIIETIREAYNLGLVEGARALISFHTYCRPPYGTISLPCFIAADYDPYNLSPYTVSAKYIRNQKPPSVKTIKVNHKTVATYYSKRSVYIPDPRGGYRIPAWRCNRCGWAYTEKLPPEHECFGSDK